MFTTTKSFAELYGYVETYFGRRRYFPEFAKDTADRYDYKQKEAARRKAGNTRIQGTAADIMKIAHCRVEQKFSELGFGVDDVRIVASIHDELVILVNKRYNPYWLLRHIREAMELRLKGFPPLFIGASVCRTWADGKSDAIELPVALSNRKMEEVRNGAYVEPFADPFQVVYDDIQEFMFNRLLEVVREDGARTREAVLNIPAVGNILGKYFSDNKDQILARLFSLPEFQVVQTEGLSSLERSSSNGNVVHVDFANASTSDKEEDDALMESLAELDREDIIDEDHEDFGQESVYYNTEVMRRLNRDKRIRLKLEDPELVTAKRSFMNDYRIMLADKKCFIRLDNTPKEIAAQLVEYLRERNVPKGYNVILNVNGKHVETSFNLSRVDRMAIIDILEQANSQIAN